jgi:predicted ATPase
MKMKIESLRIRNYRALQDVSLSEIPEFAVFVGANGSGKSTLFDVFGFLKDALDNNIRQALQKRGGFNEVVTRGHEQKDMLIEIQYRMPIVGVKRLVTYHLNIGIEKNRVIIKREILRYKRGRYGSPFHFLDFTHGKGYAVTNEEDFNKPDEDLNREHQQLDTPDLLAIKGLGQFQRFKAANAFRQLIENWYLSDFHITAARGSKDAGYAEHLSESGDNLPLVAQYIHENYPEKFDEIKEKMRKRVPGISEVAAELTVDGRLVLKYQDGAFKDPFIDRFVSDGTIKMFAYLVLLYDPQHHPLICVEEPENQLYPQLLGELAEEFRLYAQRGGQVFVSTHSPDFLNGCNLEEIFWLEKRDGLTKIHRADASTLLINLEKEGDLPGSLWKQKLFEGANL